MTFRFNDRTRWAATTWLLGPAAVLVFMFAEWLFVITKPSPTSGLAFLTQLKVLVESPWRWLLPIAAVQTMLSAMSALAYPRVRALAVLPGAVVLGVLLLLLIDNFTYTLFGFGILTATQISRVAYGTLLVLLVAWVAGKLSRAAAAAAAARHAAFLTMVTFVLTAVSLAASMRQMLPGPDLSAPPSAAQAGRAAQERPNILFLGIDGVDAALLSAYGAARPTTPFLARERDSMLFFENAFSNSTRTHGSLVTLLTGRLPFTTRVTFPPTVLTGEDTRRSLVAILKANGYATLQLGIRHYADAEDVNLFGFDAANYRWQGSSFEVKSPIASETDVFRSIVAERVNERIGAIFGLEPVVNTFAHVEGSVLSAEWRDERRVNTLERYIGEASQPWFVHLHMMDTHCCNYRPERMHFRGSDPRADLRDSQIVETDRLVERIFRALETSGRLEHTIVVISSDHTSSWESTQRVPLMMRFPRGAPRGPVAANVQLADVAPTMLAYLKLPVPQWMDGMPVLDPGALPAGRRIFGISAIKRREGPSGLRQLLDSGPPNYGAAGAMVIDGDRWYELRLTDGVMRSGQVTGHTAPAPTRLSDAEARALIEARLGPTGFRVEAH
jgi:hypothetical protein